MTIRKGMAKLLAAAAGMAVLGAGSVVCADEGIRQGVFINETDVSGMTYAQAEAVVEQKVAEALDSVITVQVGEDSVDATAVDLGLQWSNRDIVDEAIGMGNSGNLIKRYKETKDLSAEPQKLNIEFTANDSAVRRFIEEKCMQFEQEPKDASIYSDGGGGFVLEEGQTGQVIDVEESVAILKNYVSREWQGSASSVAISVEVEEPKGNTEDLETIQDKLGSYTTYYGSTYGRNTNVERGAELINNHVIWPGDTFSVCDHLVPFTAENGYELGGAYSNGEVVQEYGGGICQVSTTLYNALLEAEIEIVERHNHTMSVTYVPTSMDAAIAEGSMDLIFRNNLDTPIFISGYGYGGELTFTVWGKETRPADRYVEYYSETTSSSGVPANTKFVTVDQPVGYLSQKQAAMAGSSAVLYKYITYNGETTVEQVNTSTYQSTPATYEVGVAGASEALLSAIYSGSLEAVQQAMAAPSTEKETETETTAPETTAPETTAPETTAPETTAPETTAPETTAPETAAPEVVVPETTAPEGSWVDTPDGEVWVEGGASADGVVVWE